MTPALEVQTAHPLTYEQLEELARCASSFRYFLRHWHYVNRETGKIMAFGPCDCGHEWSLWPGQDEFAACMEEHPRIFALKAGKLGFTELECAWDGHVARFRQRNARVNLFSMDGTSAKALLGIVKFGLQHLPPWMQLPFANDKDELESFAGLLNTTKERLSDTEAGAKTTESLTLIGGVDDKRVIKSYAAGPDASIDSSAQHSHVDELARMRFPESTWTAIQSTIAGSVHIVSRGKGAANYTAKLYQSLMDGEGGGMVPFFVGWSGRPVDETGAPRDDAWYERQAQQYAPDALKQWAPRNWKEAISGGSTLRFRFDESVHVVRPFEIPVEWLRWTGTDYGFTAQKVSPWWTGFFAESPAGTIYLYDEVYGAQVPPAEQAQRIVYKMGDQRIKAHAGGQDFFQTKHLTEQGEPVQVANDYKAKGIEIVAVSNDRLQGWAQFDRLLAYKREGDQVIDPPRFVVFASCREFLRTFPALPSHPHRPEDVDNAAEVEDDPADGARHALMWRFSHLQGQRKRPGRRLRPLSEMRA